MTGAKKVQRSQIRDYNGFNVVRIEVRGNTARLFVNEGFVVSTRIDEYANFVRIRMSHDPWEYFKVDNFHAIDLGEEVQAVRE